MAKEKTKAELLQELNETLKKENEKLKSQNEKYVDEIRGLKSSNNELIIKNKNLIRNESIVSEYEKLKEQVLGLINENRVLNQQISILIEGLNNISQSVGRYYENEAYIHELGKKDFEIRIGNIQNLLNDLEKKEQEKNKKITGDDK